MTIEPLSDGETAPAPSEPLSSSPDGQFIVPGISSSDYTDGRQRGEWESKYPPDARRCINQEARILAFLFFIYLLGGGVLLGLSEQSLQIPLIWSAQVGADAPEPSLILHVDFRLLTQFFVGGLGGTTFSAKWLVHATAKRSWHLDRRYWRFFVPLIGGVYACVVLTLLDGGILGSQNSGQRSTALTAAFAFLVGYFSDGVSGLLSNIANAVFGTLEKK